MKNIQKYGFKQNHENTPLPMTTETTKVFSANAMYLSWKRKINQWKAISKVQQTSSGWE